MLRTESEKNELGNASVVSGKIKIFIATDKFTNNIMHNYSQFLEILRKILLNNIDSKILKSKNNIF